MALEFCKLIEYQKLYRKCATKASPRHFFDVGKQPKTTIACKESFYKSDIWKEVYVKALKGLAFFFQTIRYPYVARMHSCATRVSLVCTRMSSVCHSQLSKYHPYVIRMYSYVIRISLVCGFTMNPFKSFLHLSY